MKDIRWRVCFHVQALERRQADLGASMPSMWTASRSADGGRYGIIRKGSVVCSPSAHVRPSDTQRSQTECPREAYHRKISGWKVCLSRTACAEKVRFAPASRKAIESWNELSPSSRGLALAYEPAPRRDSKNRTRQCRSLSERFPPHTWGRTPAVLRRMSDHRIRSVAN